MFWAFVFTLIMASLGDSSVKLPEGDKLIKKYVEDDERKKELLSLLDVSKDERKAHTKDGKKVVKKLDDEMQHREFTDEFHNLVSEKMELRKALADVDLDYIYKSRELVSEQEWSNMSADLKKEMVKFEKQLDKKTNSALKSFDKLEKTISNTIADSEKAQICLNSFTTFKTDVLEIAKAYQTKLTDDSSIIYQHKIGKDQIVELQDDHQQNLIKLFTAYSTFRSDIVKNTTEDEWKKIHKKLELPF